MNETSSETSTASEAVKNAALDGFLGSHQDGSALNKDDDLFDDGGWFLKQVIVWIVTRDLEKARLLSTPSGERVYDLYRGNDPSFPERTDGEEDSDFALRREAWREQRYNEERPKIRRGRTELLQQLRAGDIIAINSITSSEVPKAKWQLIDLFSYEAMKVFRYPSNAIRKRWPKPPPGRPIQAEVENAVLEKYKANRTTGTPPPKREFVIKDICRQLNANVRQVTEAIKSVPAELKNCRGAPPKTRTNKSNK